jgi:hypothetical protein
MHMVTLLRAPAALDRAAAALGARQGISAYEARTRLAGDYPRVVAVLADRALAEEQARGLRADGLAAAVLDGADVVNDRRRDMAASLAFEPGAVVATMRDGRTREVAYEAVELLIHGVRTGVTTSSEESTVKSFSAGRALLTGGLSMRTTKTVTTTKTTEQREAFVYLRERSVPTVLAAYERSMNYGFLGAALAPSSMANFTTVLTTLRTRCPGARYDQRLTRPGGFGVVPLCPPGVDPAAWKSDVAAALVSLDG